MTTLYKPVKIETAEQAEALPIGTVLTRGWPHQPTLVTEYDGRRGYGAPGRPVKAEGTVGWTALVPIEAEEEWTAMGSDNGDPWIAHIGHDGIDGSREEAEAYTRRFGGFVARRALTPWEEA